MNRNNYLIKRDIWTFHHLGISQDELVENKENQIKNTNLPHGKYVSLLTGPQWLSNLSLYVYSNDYPSLHNM